MIKQSNYFELKLATANYGTCNEDVEFIQESNDNNKIQIQFIREEYTFVMKRKKEKKKVVEELNHIPKKTRTIWLEGEA